MVSEGAGGGGGSATTTEIPRPPGRRWDLWMAAAAFLGLLWRWSHSSDDAETGPESEGGQIAIPGARAVDHGGFVVPDLDQAVDFFRDVLGAAVLWQVGPVSGRKLDLRAMFNADPRATARLAMLRLGPNLNLELSEFTVPGEARTAPLSSEVGVGHLAFAVDDIAAAGAYLRAKGVRLLQGPNPTRTGPNAGEASWYFLSPWGMPLELIHRPASLPYERRTAARLYRYEEQA